MHMEIIIQSAAVKIRAGSDEKQQINKINSDLTECFSFKSRRAVHFAKLTKTD